MPYVKHNWVPAEVISEALMDHLETQYDEVFNEIVRVQKTSDETVNDSAVLQNDDELLFAVGANEVWSIFMYVLCSNANATPNIKFQFSLPAGGDLKGTDPAYIGQLAADTALNVLSEWTAGAIAKVLPIGTRLLLFWGLYVGAAAAGNVQMQWAQDVAHASDTKVLENSFIEAHLIV